jgi:hypothetical protein
MYAWYTALFRLVFAALITFLEVLSSDGLLWFFQGMTGGVRNQLQGLILAFFCADCVAIRRNRTTITSSSRLISTKNDSQSFPLS